MSARPLSMAGQRPSAVTLTNSILFGSLKSAVAISRAMSMSNPTSWPLSSLNAKGGTVVSVTTISLPRSSTTSMRDFSWATTGDALATTTAASAMATKRRTGGVSMSVSFRVLLRPEQERPQLLRLPEQPAERCERAVDGRGKLGGAAEPGQRLRRDELEEDVGAAGRHADEVHGEHVVVLEQQHAERGRRLERHDGRLLHAPALHGNGQQVVGQELRRRRRLVQPAAEDRPQRRRDPLRGVDELLNALGAVLLERAH